MDILSQGEYEQWLIAIDSDPARIEDRTAATMMAHINALLDRIDKLMDHEEHDRLHGRDCRCWLVRCACAYDYPDAKCGWHFTE